MTSPRKDSWAAYWADLSNLDDLGDESAVDRWLVRKARLQLKTRHPSPPLGDPRPNELLGAKLKLDGTKLPSLETLPATFREQARGDMRERQTFAQILRPLLAGEKCLLPPEPSDKRVHAQLTGDGFVRLSIGVVADKLDKQWLYAALREGPDPFPIKKCPNCGKAFARQGKRIFCTADCAKNALERRRSGTEGRKAQLREAQRKFRMKASRTPRER